MRTSLFVGVALYAWATIRLLERRRFASLEGVPALHP
jgi:hypothetical protein